ncbi:hypothetical protein BJ878DRAFT_481999 [Calycina marina]|uniref:Uncharacterized protein n=1 Tax=Calycina marina TaxID=1763456 RepID=A0A9P8CEM5_9HELO|nr:hypothetical protein BJ878DRAFT_481999 [Calycina marina]
MPASLNFIVSLDTVLAIVPTASGQIGINSVESHLGNQDTYLVGIYGSCILYITETDTSAHATPATSGQCVGDISYVIPEALAQALQDSVTTAIDACGKLNVPGKSLATPVPDMGCTGQKEEEAKFPCLEMVKYGPPQILEQDWLDAQEAEIVVLSNGGGGTTGGTGMADPNAWTRVINNA